MAIGRVNFIRIPLVNNEVRYYQGRRSLKDIHKDDLKLTEIPYKPQCFWSQQVKEASIKYLVSSLNFSIKHENCGVVQLFSYNLYSILKFLQNIQQLSF